MDFGNAILLLLLMCGHTTLWVGLVNRTHAWPVKSTTLKRIRHLHDVMVPLMPVLVLWRVGLTGPRLLLEGSWQSVPAYWLVFFAFCAAGTVWLCVTVTRNLTYQPPSSQQSNHSGFYNIAQELGYRPIERGPYQRLARLPLNQQYRLEFNEKTFCVAGLPTEWDGLSLLHITDWHFQKTVGIEYFQRVCEIIREHQYDILCFTGDLIDNPHCMDWIPETLGTLNARLGKYYILGNHDWYQDARRVRLTLDEQGWQDASRETRVLERSGSRLEIGGDETPWMGTCPTFSSLADFRILLSHTPDNIPWAREQKIPLMLSGHNHGGQIRLPLIGAVFSPSRFGTKYAAGTFLESGTLLHVSRGLSGQHPLRWRCLPEVTRMVLRAVPTQPSEPAERSESSDTSFAADA